MNVLFIGGTGNISSACARLLRRRGHDVTVLTRGRRPAPEGCCALQADRHDAAALRRAVQASPPQVVINFLGFDTPDLELDYQAFNSPELRQYLFISSATVYAKPHRRLPLTEDSPIGNPFSEYAQGKQRCEDWLMRRFREQHFPATIVRPSHTYGPGWLPNPVASAGYTFGARLEQGAPVFVHDDGQGLWTLTASEDFAVGLAGLVGRSDSLGEAFHIASDEVLTWNLIYDEIARALGVEPPDRLHIPTDWLCTAFPELGPKLRGDKSEAGVFDNAKIKRYVPDFACRKSFRDGIRESVAWLREDPARRECDPSVDALFDRVATEWRKERDGER